MSLLKEKCKNITNANKYIASIIQRYNCDDFVDDPEIKQLVEYHPTKHINLNDVEYLVMRKRHPFNTISLFYKHKNTSNEDDISWKTCIRKLYGKHDGEKDKMKDIENAFRTVAYKGERTQYFQNNTFVTNAGTVGICNHCNIKSNQISVDHYLMPFKTILQTFLDENNIHLNEIDVFENERNEIELKDTQISSMWLTYHDEKAQYRLLCKSCNSHFGSYGY